MLLVRGQNVRFGNISCLELYNYDSDRKQDE